MMATLSVTELTQERSYLLGIAYRMLGSASDAEDIVQEALIRASHAGDLRSPRAFLTTVVTRLCLDELGRARRRKQAYIGLSLPEPIPTDDFDGGDAEQRETVGLALLIVLEELSPLERAVFVLRDVFELEFREIAEALSRSEVACRKLLTRARDRIQAGRQCPPALSATQRVVANAFFSALASGDLQGLVTLLAHEATLSTDHGGKVSAARRVLRGSDLVARFLHGLYVKGQRNALVYTLTPALLNGAPALVLRGETGAVEGSFTLEIRELSGHARVVAVRVMRNPDKLVALDRAAVGHDARRPPSQQRSQARQSQRVTIIAIREWRCLQIAGQCREARIAQQAPKGRQTNKPFADHCVAIDPRAKRFLGVVEVKGFEMPQSHAAVELTDGPCVASRSCPVDAGRPHVLRVQAHAQPRVAAERQDGR
jgi:RNA polymerase sigma-70 factor (ECF subfamily)